MVEKESISDIKIKNTYFILQALGLSEQLREINQIDLSDYEQEKKI